MHSVDTIVEPQALEPAAALAIPHLRLSLADVERWHSTAEPESTLAYHVGFLALDRGACSRLGEDAGEELDRIATALMAMAEAGRVHLIQRRNGACDYTYLAVMSRTGVRRSPGHPGRESAS